MPVAGAVASAKLAKVGFRGYALAVTVGLALGVGSARTMWTVGNNVAARMKGDPGSLKEWYFRTLYFAAMLWILVALFLGGWVSSVVLRLVL
jgi:hypothetical protein